jgi:squalene synthase HpnC
MEDFGGRVSAEVETPSGKGAGDENFQVGSVLLPAKLRPHVMAFYHFVRAADDVADNPALTREAKLERLGRFRRALLDPGDAIDFEKAKALHASLAATGVTPQHACDLLSAFEQDATKRRYADWADLMGYCRLSASPVGRFLLDLHGEDRALWAFSDPLCDALQVLNHLQDCQDDYRKLDRVYLPMDAFSAAGIGVDALDERSAGPALRGVLDRLLDATDRLLGQAGEAPRWMRNRRLAAETAVVLEMARQLSAALRRKDPLAERVELSKPRFAWAGLLGLVRLVGQRALGGAPDARRLAAGGRS